MESVSGDGHSSALANLISFSQMARGDVCEGDHWLDVMNPWDALTMRVWCLAIGKRGNFSGIQQVAVVGNEC